MIGELPEQRIDVELEDQRNPVQRDRDRILYCSAFRRLSGVTQVVSPEEGHIFHNRLTHSLEVAQIGRRLAENLVAKHGELDADHFKINCDAVEAACLAHDLGHPPFGHVAEEELDHLITDGQHERDGYEGNAQSFRIVTKLAVRSVKMGLNLTRVTLNAILKYPWYRGMHDHKWGAYRTERKHFNHARNCTDDAVSDKTPSVEAAIMTWADDIAYSIHDTEDFYRAGLIPLDRLAGRQADERSRFFHAVALRWQQDKDNDAFKKLEDYRRVFDNVCQTLLHVSEPYNGTRSQRLSLRSFTSVMIGRYLSATQLQQNDKKPLMFTDELLADEMRMLKELTWHYVIHNPSLAAQQHGYRTIIRKLFDVFVTACFGRSREWAILPPRYKEEMQVLSDDYGGNIGHELRVRTAADAVAGLTDVEALRIYQRLTGIQPGSAIDPIAV